MDDRETEPDPFAPQEDTYVVLENEEVCCLCGDLASTGYRDEDGLFFCEICYTDRGE